VVSTTSYFFIFIIILIYVSRTHTHMFMNAVFEKILFFSHTANYLYNIVVELKYCYFNSTTMRMQTCAACKSFIYLYVAIISFKLTHSE
jgi:hypothetical protein